MTRPVAKQIKATGREDASSIPIRLVGSDIDAGDAVISFRLSNLPGNGTLFLDAAMTRVAKVGTSYLASGEALQLYFKPAANFNGTLSFQYTAFDGSTRSDPATASLTVTAVNDAPIANADALTRISEDSGARTILASTLLGNDVEGPANEASQTLKIIGVSNAVGGTVKLVAGNIVFTPSLNYNGPASFTYTIQDNGLTNGLADPKTSSAKASFTIGAVNDKPIAKADALTSVAEDSGARTILASALLGNDADGPANEAGQTLKIVAVSNAVGGMVQLVGGNVVFTPNANFNGAASFTYTVQDNGLTAGVADPKTASAKASFTITRVNDAPIANDDVLTSVGEDSGARTISAATLLANDARGPANESGQILKITGVSDAVGGTVDLVNGNVVFAPAAHFNGTASFTYTVQDNGLTAGVSDPKISTATVAFEVNDAPVAAAVAASGRDNSRSIPITLSATDPNTGDTIESFTLKSLSANGTIYLDAALTQTVSADTAYAATGNQLQLFFDPAPDFVGTTSFSYVASDGHANSGTASASITTIDGFDIDFRYTGDESLRHFFTAAAARWEEIITADLPDINASSIGLGIIDDLNIAATIEFIDGVSGILGSAGPEYVRNSSSLPLTGIMRFDSADVANLVAAGQFDEVILHEMGHVLGIGTIWNRFAGLIDVAKLNYFGANALAEYRNLKGDQTLTSIPLEDGGGGGTAGSHWEEDIFDNELLTGYLDGGRANPISRMTVASLKDLGYQVDLDAADPYTLPVTGLRLDGGGDDEVGRFIVLPPDDLLLV